MATGLYIGDTAVGKINVGTFSENGHDTSTATASATDILNGKTAFISSGKVTGSMPNNGSIGVSLDTSTTSYTIPKGYHSGSGVISISLEEKTVAPSTIVQTIVPTGGNVLSKVIVSAVEQGGITPSGTINITANGIYDVATYATAEVSVSADSNSGIDTSDATAAASDIASGKTAYVNGEKITGSLYEYKSDRAMFMMNGAYILPYTHNGVKYIGVLSPNGSDSIIRSSTDLYTGVVATAYGDAVAADVAAGKTFTSASGAKITGTLTTQKYYTGSTVPSSSLGADGDIYLKT